MIYIGRSFLITARNFHFRLAFILHRSTRKIITFSLIFLQQNLRAALPFHYSRHFRLLRLGRFCSSAPRPSYGLAHINYNFTNVRPPLSTPPPTITSFSIFVQISLADVVSDFSRRPRFSPFSGLKIISEGKNLAIFAHFEATKVCTRNFEKNGTDSSNRKGIDT